MDISSIGELAEERESPDRESRVILPRIGKGYTAVPNWIFNDMCYLRLSDRGKALLPYLMAGPGAGRSRYFLPPGIHVGHYARFAADMGWDTSVLKETMGELAEAGWILTDELNGLVLVPSVTTSADNPDDLKGTLRKLADVPESQLRQKYFELLLDMTFKVPRKWSASEEQLLRTLEFYLPEGLAIPQWAFVRKLSTPNKKARGREHQRTPCRTRGRTQEQVLPHGRVESCADSSCADSSLELLGALHPMGDRWSVCAFGPGVAHYGHFDDAQEALSEAWRLDQLYGIEGVFWGLGALRDEVCGRGRSADVVRIQTAWADIDTKDASGNPDQALAHETLELSLASGRIPPPSAVVETGGGVHAYWLLDEPVTGTNLMLIPPINRALAERVGGDDVGDLARVLRVPGTRTRKPEHPDKPMCRIHSLDLGRRYALPWLAWFLDVDTIQTGTSPLVPIREVRFQDATPSRWMEIMAGRPKLQDLWKTPVPVGERSEVAMSLANHAVHAGLANGDEIATILKNSPALGSWAEEKPSALGRTIAKARGAKTH